MRPGARQRESERLEPVNGRHGAALIKRTARGSTHRAVHRPARRQMAGVPACVGRQTRAVLAYRPDEEISKIDGRRCITPPRQAVRRKPDNWTMDTYLEGGGSPCPKGGFPSESAGGNPAIPFDTAGAVFQVVRRHLVDAKGNLTVKTDEGAAGATNLKDAKLMRLPGRRMWTAWDVRTPTTSGWSPAKAR